MERSESIVKISSALNNAQKKIGGAVKGAANPFFKSKYANLNAVMEACKDSLNEEGITVLQPICSDANGDYVETILLHASGEFISSKMKLIIAKDDMQAYGSATSYARRYGLQSMVFIPAEDDDNELNMNRASQHASKPALVSKPAVGAIAVTSSATGVTSGSVTIAQAAEAKAQAVTEAAPAAKKTFRKLPSSTPASAAAAQSNSDGGW